VVPVKIKDGYSTQKKVLGRTKRRKNIVVVLPVVVVVVVV
jgi:hypothetical protein